MSRVTYELLLTLLKDNLMKKSIRHPIDFECRLAITLSYLSQGVSPKFLAWTYKIGKSTAREIILKTCDVLWRVLAPVYVKRPTKEDYQQIEANFNQKWNLPNYIGAIDGKHIDIQAPPNSGSSYFNYKQRSSIALLDTCDANYRFTDVSVGAYGSQSDGGILRESTFGKELFGGKLPIPSSKSLYNSNKVFPHYFVGDAAFPLCENLMRPYPGKSLTPDKDIYNYRLSRARRVIENAFGILVARWRILKTKIPMLPENAEKVVLATIALHNFILINDIDKKCITTHFADWEDANHGIHIGEWHQETSSLNSVRIRSNNSTTAAKNLREDLKHYLCNEGSLSFQYNRSKRPRL